MRKYFEYPNLAASATKASENIRQTPRRKKEHVAKCFSFEALDPHRTPLRAPIESGRYYHAEANVDILRGTYNQLPYQLKREDLQFTPTHVRASFVFDYL